MDSHVHMHNGMLWCVWVWWYIFDHRCLPSKHNFSFFVSFFVCFVRLHTLSHTHTHQFYFYLTLSLLCAVFYLRHFDHSFCRYCCFCCCYNYFFSSFVLFQFFWISSPFLFQLIYYRCVWVYIYMCVCAVLPSKLTNRTDVQHKWK